jgi:hypothetical protein
LLSCGDCRGAGQCITCYRERRERYRRVLRRQRMAALSQRAALFACIAMSGAAAVGVALLPDRSLCLYTSPHALIVARGQVRLVGEAVQRFADSHGDDCPASLGTVHRAGYLDAAPVDPWGEPLLYGCVDTPRAFVVLSKGPDQQPGTDDDLMYSSP